MFDIAPLDVLSQEIPSFALVANELRPSGWLCRSITRLAPYGLSDGSRIVLPEDISSDVRWRAVNDELSSLSVAPVTIELVTRPLIAGVPALEPNRSRVLDQRFQHAVHRRQGARGGLVAALKADQVGHFFIQRHAGDALALVLDRRDGRLHVGLFVARAFDAAAHPLDERRVAFFRRPAA